MSSGRGVRQWLPEGVRPPVSCVNTARNASTPGIWRNRRLAAQAFVELLEAARRIQEPIVSLTQRVEALEAAVSMLPSAMRLHDAMQAFVLIARARRVPGAQLEFRMHNMTAKPKARPRKAKR